MSVNVDSVATLFRSVHPLLAERAKRYEMTVDEYKRRNLLKTEVASGPVGAAIVQLCSDEFAATTGAQLPIDGGSDRVI